jgi:hypothetical protein
MTLDTYCEQRSDDKSTLYSRTGYDIYFMGWPITWVSKMQTEVTLLTTEAEYAALSRAMCDVVPFLDLVEELSTYFKSLIISSKYIFTKCWAC